MTDRREEILARMLVVLDALETATGGAFRNRTEIADGMRPCVVLVDGDEEAEDRDSNRGGIAPRRVHMTPEVILLAGANADEIGTTLNAIRAEAIYALANDTELTAWTLDDNAVVYEGASTMVDNGRRVEGVLVLRFSLTYVLRPNELAVSG